MSSPIEVTGLTKEYAGRPAVDGVDLRIERGEVFALLGPNGAGKTTSVEILEGFRRRDRGDVRVLGEDPQTAGLEWRQRLGIVLQSSQGLDLLTVREIVASTAKVYRDARDVDEVIEAVGLTEKRDTRTAQLSGGQRRRLDVALGIVGRPELLFLDEPTTGFDPRARRAFWELIASLAQDHGTTILLTTHYLDEAEHLADRVGIIAGGRMLTVDTPARLGGRAQQEATVSWLEDGRTRSVRTARPTAEVAALATRLGGEVPELVVSRPTLEETYLRLIAPFTDELAHLDGQPHVEPAEAHAATPAHHHPEGALR
ncbi:MAG TPA: ABC transporter ATP-binding protein [Pedococcus sp.]|jgi:ABC-2 type transport system ATP-binding protein|uniref:ABC transporter ATP-binding protein n=1 Tax=Pedococcus sp. TaxID=2860345 RepID=UPI002F95A87E